MPGMDTLELDALMIRHRAVMERILDYSDPMEALCDVLIPAENVLNASLKAATIMAVSRSEKLGVKPRAGAVSATVKGKVVERQSRGTPARKIKWMAR